MALDQTHYISKDRGFTLIELIMVIVILGILSAFALPKFADFQGDAEASSLEGARGAVRSATAIAHAACLAASDCASTGSSTVTIEGETINMIQSYPDRDDVVTVASLDGYFTANSTVTVGTPATAVDTLLIALEDQDGSRCFAYHEANATANVVAAVSAAGTYTSATPACSGAF